MSNRDLENLLDGLWRFYVWGIIPFAICMVVILKLAEWALPLLEHLFTAHPWVLLPAIGLHFWLLHRFISRAKQAQAPTP